MNTRKAALAATLSLSLANFASFGCASGAPPDADHAPPGQAADDFDQYECPNCIGAGESTIDEDESQ
jgi:hypothetical protein